MRFMDGHNLPQVGIIFDVVVISLENYLAFFEKNYVVDEVEEIYGVCHEDSGFVLQLAHEDILEDLLFDVGVKSWNGVVHEDDFLIGINCSRKWDSSLLPTTKVDSFLTNFGHIARW